MELQLILPRKEYIPGYYDLCREYGSEATSVGLHNPDGWPVWRFTLIRTLENYALGIGLPAGHVPVTHFWTLLEGQVVGVGSIRHRLNESLERFGGHIGYVVRPSQWGRGIGTKQLSLLIAQAGKLGIHPALMTCDDRNTASWRVMEKNGAVYQDTIETFAWGIPRMTRRYWVQTQTADDSAF